MTKAKSKPKIGLKVSSTLDIETAFNEFIRYSKAKNLSPSTIRNYHREFIAFHRWFDGNFEDINPTTIILYIEFLQEKNISIASVNTALRILRVILNYWYEQGYCHSIKVKLLKADETIKDTYTDTEISKLLKKPDIKKAGFTEFRTWVIINFLLGTGCRLSTLIAIRIADIDWENELIRFSHTKNKRGQFVPLSRQLGTVLQEYLRYRKGESEDLLFPSETNTKLLPTSVAHSVAKYNRERGVTKTSCHLFRHTFVKNWILQGGDILRLQKVIGHQSVQMVQHYSNLYGQDLKHNFEEFNLLSRLKADKISLRGGRN
jgi:integrase/recombinase XerD